MFPLQGSGGGGGGNLSAFFSVVSALNTVVDPDAGDVIVSLDAQHRAHKSVYIEAPMAVEAIFEVQASINAVDWRTVELIVLYPSGSAFASVNAMEVLKGYRYVRVLCQDSVTGDVTAEITAQV